MKLIKKFLSTAVALAAVFAVSSCNDDNDNNNSDGTAQVKVRMTDAPGDYDQVNVEVIDVKYKANADASENGWISIGNVNPQIYNLLDLTGGVSVLLADTEIQAGQFSQLRLVLGENNTVVKNGVTHNLSTPSAQQSGLKLQVNQQLLAGGNYDFLIDFDVDESIVEAGNSGNYILKPVLRVSQAQASGSIKGIVTPGPYQVVASVVANGETISAYTNSLGEFVLHGVPNGTYTLAINVQSGFGFDSAIYVDNVVVANGEITNVGLISL